jgi:hypothetical protein
MPIGSDRPPVTSSSRSRPGSGALLGRGVAVAAVLGNAVADEDSEPLAPGGGTGGVGFGEGPPQAASDQAIAAASSVARGPRARRRRSVVIVPRLPRGRAGGCISR